VAKKEGRKILNRTILLKIRRSPRATQKRLIGYQNSNKKKEGRKRRGREGRPEGVIPGKKKCRVVKGLLFYASPRRIISADLVIDENTDR